MVWRASSFGYEGMLQDLNILNMLPLMEASVDHMIVKSEKSANIDPSGVVLIILLVFALKTGLTAIFTVCQGNAASCDGSQRVLHCMAGGC